LAFSEDWHDVATLQTSVTPVKPAVRLAGELSELDVKAGGGSELSILPAGDGHSGTVEFSGEFSLRYSEFLPEIADLLGPLGGSTILPFSFGHPFPFTSRTASGYQDGARFQAFEQGDGIGVGDHLTFPFVPFAGLGSDGVVFVLGFFKFSSDSVNGIVQGAAPQVFAILVFVGVVEISGAGAGETLTYVSERGLKQYGDGVRSTAGGRADLCSSVGGV
jgi:hypothetical protein